MTQVIDKFTGKNRFLSNFWPCLIKYKGVFYPSAEHAYQSAKTIIPHEKRKFQRGTTAGQAKRLGRTITLRSDWMWHGHRQSVMHEILRYKFNDLCHPNLVEKLIATGDSTLIEGNHWNDDFWGVCTPNGQNHLGLILMKIRKELQDGNSN